MRVLLFCLCFSWVGMMGGFFGCKRSATEGVASARTTPDSRFSKRMSQALERRAAPAIPQARFAPAPQGKIKPASAQLKKDLASLSMHLRRVQEAYNKAYRKGKIENWKAYYKAFHISKAAEKQFARSKKRIAQYDPALAKNFSQSMKALAQAIKQKAHPQTTGRHTYAILQAAFQLNPRQKSTLLTQYRRTIQKVKKALVAQKTAGLYKVGLMVESPKTLYRLSEVRKRDIHTTIRPSKSAAMTLSAFIQHSGNGMPIAGTDVSLELLDGRTRRQLSTQKLHLVWDGFPKYSGHLTLPPKSHSLIVQITVSIYAGPRTRYSSKMLRSRSTLRFKATRKGRRLLFADAPKKNAIQASGADLMRATALVGNQTSVGGPYRVGLALVPMQSIYKYNNGTLKQARRGRYTTCQLVAFVQDRRTGLLIPNARIEAFIYWRHHRTGTHRTRVLLKPVFDGFFSYRANLTVRKHYTFNIRARVDPPLVSRTTYRLPGTYTTHFKALKHPARARRFRRR